jgi:ligand-binding sensor domain-containing protein
MRLLTCAVVIMLSLFSCEKPSQYGHITPGNPNSKFNQKILDGYFVTSIAFDSKGNAWIGTFKQGLIMYNSRETIVYNSTNSIIPDNIVIWDIAVDTRDNIWMGCDGLLKFDGTDFILYNSANTPMPEDFVYSLAIDSRDNIWFTSCRFQEGGIVKYNGTGWDVFTPDNSDLPVNMVNSIAIDKRDNVWLALGEKVNQIYFAKISGNNWTTYTEKDIGFSPYSIGNIEINSNNELCASVDYSLSSTWFNSGPQVFVFNGSKSTQLKFDSETKIKHITVDNEDNIWCNTYSGYAVYNWDKWVVDDSIFKDIGSFTIAQSPENRIWIGTGNGIYLNE